MKWAHLGVVGASGRLPGSVMRPLHQDAPTSREPEDDEGHEASLLHRVLSGALA